MVGKEEEGRRKKPRKKPLRRDQDLNPRTLSPEPSVLSIRPRPPAHLIVKINNGILPGPEPITLGNLRSFELAGPFKVHYKSLLGKINKSKPQIWMISSFTTNFLVLLIPGSAGSTIRAHWLARINLVPELWLVDLHVWAFLTRITTNSRMNKMAHWMRMVWLKFTS